MVRSVGRYERKSHVHWGLEVSRPIGKRLETKFMSEILQERQETRLFVGDKSPVHLCSFGGILKGKSS